MTEFSYRLRGVFALSLAAVSLLSVAAHAESGKVRPLPDRESVREYIERTREWTPNQYIVNRSPDRDQLQIFHVRLVAERPAFVEGGSSFDVIFDVEAQRVVGERHTPESGSN